MKIWVVTLGCTHNISDSEVMKGYLSEYYTLVSTLEEANIVIINSCAKTAREEKELFDLLAEIEKTTKYVIIAGCVPQLKPEELENCSLVGTDQIHRIVEIVEETINDNPFVLLAHENSPRLHFPKKRNNEHIEIVPIVKGCNKSCTFCVIPHTRGKLHSYATEAIHAAIVAAKEEGIKEIWLTGDELGCYGEDLGGSTNIISLLESLDDISDVRIRIGSLAPQYIIKYQKELVKILSHETFFSYLLSNLESGSDEVLEAMGREYTSEDFVSAILFLKEHIPDLVLSTDVIVGFPEETDEHFQKTIDALRKLEPEELHVYPYSPRPKTKALGLLQTSADTIMKRKEQLERSYHLVMVQKMRAWKGSRFSVYFTEEMKKGIYLGRSPSFKSVLVKSSESLLGQTHSVVVKEISKEYLIGELDE